VAPAPSDPFFDRPYEERGASAAPPDSEAASRTSAPVRALSPNIRAKRKVAALLGGSKG